MPNDGRQIDRDGVTVTSTGNVRTGVWLLMLALGLIAVMLVLVVGPSMEERPGSAAPQPGERVAASASGKEGKALPAARRSRESAAGERPHLPPVEPQPAAVNDADGAPSVDAATEHAEEHAADGEAEEPSGIALFPPPGTDPIQAGIVVPDDFELPAGFVRHYQTTDNGKQLPAILKFHPDYQPVDENGERIALPEDRVVPPELAPPGLPHQMLDVPDDTVPMMEGPNDRPDVD